MLFLRIIQISPHFYNFRLYRPCNSEGDILFLKFYKMQNIISLSASDGQGNSFFLKFYKF